jgi:glycosyltransferase WbpL
LIVTGFVLSPAGLILTAFGLSFVGVLAMRHCSQYVGLVDVVNERSSHVAPTPRGGGLAFVIVIPTMTAIVASRQGRGVTTQMAALLLASVLVAVVSLADDRWSVPASLRFSAHLTGALMLLASGAVLREISIARDIAWQLGVLSMPITLLWIVGLTNAYNFMDGIDGLAAGHAVIVGSSMAWLAYVLAAPEVASAMLILAAGALGFLIQNWPPAKIFMGDVGSAFLGFSLAGWAVVSGALPFDAVPVGAWVIVLSPFILDTSITFVWRVVRGERWYEPHRKHFYQRLIRRGWSHLSVTTVYLIATGLLGLVTVAHYGYGHFSPLTFALLCASPLVATGILVWRAEHHDYAAAVQ